MALILVVDQDVATSRLVSETMARVGHTTRTAVEGKTAVKMAVTTAPQLIICELRLPDVTGIEVLRLLRNYNVAAPLIMMSAAGSVRHVADAMKGGAVDFLEKPVDVAMILGAVDEALHTQGGGDQRDPIADRHSAQRWADVVVRAVLCTRDPRTLQAWARSAGVSVGALRARCQIAGVPPKRSLNFARLLRAVMLRSKYGVHFEDSLDIVDKRTLRKLLSCASLGEREPVAVDRFVAHQKFVLNASLIAEIVVRLSQQAGGRSDFGERAHAEYACDRQRDLSSSLQERGLMLSRPPYLIAPSRRCQR